VPTRRVLGIALVGLLTVGVVATAALSAGPSQQITRPYSSHHTFISEAARLCVETTARGTAIATRSGHAPLVRWTDVHLRDPTLTAAGYRLTAGRCDHAHPVRFAAILQQTWSARDGAASSRRSDEGPATTLRQFNSGAPVRLPDLGFPRAVFSSDYAIDGRVLVDARVNAGSEGFDYSSHVTLDSASR
jgi:hypothetical protein